MDAAADARMSAAAEARTSADAAARRARVDIRELTTIDEMHEAGQLFSEVWRTPGGCPEISDDLLSALAAGRQLRSGCLRGRLARTARRGVGRIRIRPSASLSRPSSIRT